MLGGIDGESRLRETVPHVLGGLHEAVERAGVPPSERIVQEFHLQRPLPQIDPVEVGDLQFAAVRRDDGLRQLRDVPAVEIQPRDRIIRLRILRFLLDIGDIAAGVESHDAESLRVLHPVTEYGGHAGGRIGGGVPEEGTEALPAEQVVPQDHGAGFPAYELLPDDERLCEAVGGRLHRIGYAYAEVGTVAEEFLELADVGRGGYDQYVPDAGIHEDGEGVEHHRLVVYREQLLGRGDRQRVEAGARAPCEDYPFHYPKLCYLHYIYLIQHPFRNRTASLSAQNTFGIRNKRIISLRDLSPLLTQCDGHSRRCLNAQARI